MCNIALLKSFEIFIQQLYTKIISSCKFVDFSNQVYILLYLFNGNLINNYNNY